MCFTLTVVALADVLSDVLRECQEAQLGHDVHVTACQKTLEATIML